MIHSRLAIRPAVLVAALFGAAACNVADTSSTASWQTVTDTIGDTVVVRTVGVVDESAELPLLEELRIGQFDGPDEYTFGNVWYAVPRPDGGVYVWDNTLHVLRQYDSTGTFVRQLGRRGGGPGEYQDVNGLVLLPDGRLALWDSGNARVTFYDSTGAHVGELRAQTTMFSNRGFLADTAGRMYLLNTLDAFDPANPGAERRRGYVRYAADGAVLDSLVTPDMPEAQTLSVTMKRGQNTMHAMFPVPYAPQPIWMLSPHGHFVTTSGDVYAVTLHRADAPLRIEREVAPVAVEPDDRENQTEIVTAQIRRMSPGWTWDGPSVPETKPPIRSMEVDADGRVWVMRAVPSERIEPAPEPPADPQAPPPARWRAPAVYDVFRPDGRLLGVVRPPARTTLLHMRGDEVWASVRDSLDVPSVTRFRLALPPEP